MKTEAQLDGQWKCGLEREGTVGGGDTKPGCVEAAGQKHRPPQRSGKSSGGGCRTRCRDPSTASPGRQ